MRNHLIYRSIAALLLGALPAYAQVGTSSRPMTMVVPFAAGGGTDLTARIIAPVLGQILGQQVIVENIGGAGGMIGGSRVAKASPDGSIVLFGTISTLAFNPSLYKAPLYNSTTDFTPVALVADAPRVLVTRKDLPVNTLSDFISYAKLNSSKMQYGSAGIGSGPHVCSLLLDAAMGTSTLHVPYKGGGPAMIDLVAGRLDYMTDQISSAQPQISAGKIKAIASLSIGRAPGLESLPTAREQGLPSVNCGVWSALA